MHSLQNVNTIIGMLWINCKPSLLCYNEGTNVIEYIGTLASKLLRTVTRDRT